MKTYTLRYIKNHPPNGCTNKSVFNRVLNNHSFKNKNKISISEIKGLIVHYNNAMNKNKGVPTMNKTKLKTQENFLRRKSNNIENYVLELNRQRSKLKRKSITSKQRKETLEYIQHIKSQIELNTQRLTQRIKELKQYKSQSVKSLIKRYA